MDYQARYEAWLRDETMDEDTRRELKALRDQTEIEDRFYRDLEFGTAGMRGIMGAGTNRMNRYVIRKAARGLAEYLKQDGGGSAVGGVAIAYDTRRCSAEFAMETALTLCAAGVPAFLFSEPMATPVLSFAVRYLAAAGGVVVTASHNPKEYNGFKVYDDTGCQLLPEAADRLTAYVERASYGAPIMEEEAARAAELLRVPDEGLQRAFLEAVAKLGSPMDKGVREGLKIVYTPLHGTGATVVPAFLKREGYTQLETVPEQMIPDGSFPTVRVPNPEERDALDLAVRMAEGKGADLVLATDPDCDRISAAVRHAGGYEQISGNQLGTLLVDYMTRRAAEKLPKNATLVTTVVTGGMGVAIARSRGVSVRYTLTGFKFIGSQINQMDRDGSGTFLMGYEESCGYMMGAHVRDKDGVSVALLISEMAAWHKTRGKTLLDALDELYEAYGYYLDHVDTTMFPGIDGARRMAELMSRLRSAGTGALTGMERVLDFAPGIEGLPPSNLLKFYFSDAWLAVRPSGTEPKIKCYYSIRAEHREAARLRLQALQSEMERYL